MHVNILRNKEMVIFSIHDLSKNGISFHQIDTRYYRLAIAVAIVYYYNRLGMCIWQWLRTIFTENKYKPKQWDKIVHTNPHIKTKSIIPFDSYLEKTLLGKA